MRVYMEHLTVNEESMKVRYTVYLKTRPRQNDYDAPYESNEVTKLCTNDLKEALQYVGEHTDRRHKYVVYDRDLNTFDVVRMVRSVKKQLRAEAADNSREGAGSPAK